MSRPAPDAAVLPPGAHVPASARCSRSSSVRRRSMAANTVAFGTKPPVEAIAGVAGFLIVAGFFITASLIIAALLIGTAAGTPRPVPNRLVRCRVASFSAAGPRPSFVPAIPKLSESRGECQNTLAGISDAICSQNYHTTFSGRDWNLQLCVVNFMSNRIGDPRKSILPLVDRGFSSSHHRLGIVWGGGASTEPFRADIVSSVFALTL